MRIRPLILLLATAILAQAAEDTFDGVQRIVAIGDVHGDYRSFVGVLRAAELIDQRDRWTGGKTHLVQLGDVPDRGPDSRKVMDLLMTLEKQAAKAGGRVHALIGNHEAMNIYGDLRYTDPAEFNAFRGPDSERIREQLWEEQIKTLPTRPDAEFRKKWDAEHPPGWFEHRYEFGPKGRYGKWIRSHNAIVKINDSLFLHGGLSPSWAGRTVQDINRLIAAELDDLSKITESSAVTASDGPLWYRGLTRDEPAIGPLVDQILAAYGVTRIVIGHTPTPGAVLTRFNGKVVMADVGLSSAFGARNACLLIEEGTAYAIHRGVKIQLPTGDGPDYVRYVQEAAAADPKPSPLENFVNELATRLAQTAPK